MALCSHGPLSLALVLVVLVLPACMSIAAEAQLPLFLVCLPSGVLVLPACMSMALGGPSFPSLACNGYPSRVLVLPACMLV
jgi:hypothetical protein